MTLSRPVRATAVIVLTSFCCSCATTRLPPITVAGDEFQPLKDERRLWERSARNKQPGFEIGARAAAVNGYGRDLEREDHCP